MTVSPDASTFPAPGSTAAGAPPPLKRALTPADGIPDAPAPDRPVAVAVSAPDAGGSRLVAAAAMLGIAAGLEIANVLSRRRR